MGKFKNIWPAKDQLNADFSKVELAPYGVLKQYADSIDVAYSNELKGVVTAGFQEKPNGDRTNFTYGLYLSKDAKEDAPRVKIVEIDIQDDGWYPATVYLFGSNKEKVGEALNEDQLHTALQDALQREFVRGQIKAMLH